MVGSRSTYFADALKAALAQPSIDVAPTSEARVPEVRDPKPRTFGYSLRDGLHAYRLNAQFQLLHSFDLQAKFIRELEGHGIRVVGQVHDELILERDEHDTLPPFETCIEAAERVALGEELMSGQIEDTKLTTQIEQEKQRISFAAESETVEKRCISDLTETELNAMERDLRIGSLTAQEIADKYWLRSANIVQARKARLGLTKAHGRAAPVSHPTIDVDAELEALEKRRTELLAKKAEQEIKFEWLENTYLGAGKVDCDGKVLISGVGARFRSAGGFAKFRAWVEKEVSQVGAPPTNQLVDEAAVDFAVHRNKIANALTLINEHLSGHYVDLDDALRNLLQGYVTMRDNANADEPRDVWVVTRSFTPESVGPGGAPKSTLIHGIFETEVLAHNYRHRELNGDAYISRWRVKGKE